MNIDIEKIKAEIEKVNAMTYEEYYEKNKEELIQEFQNKQQNEARALIMILNSLQNFELKTEQQEIIENKE